MTDEVARIAAMRGAFADAFMRHPTGRMTDVEVMAVIDGLAAWCGDPEPHEPHDDEGTAAGRYSVTTCPGLRIAPDLDVERLARALSDHIEALHGATAHRLGCECSGSDDGIHHCRGLMDTHRALRAALFGSEPVDSADAAWPEQTRHEYNAAVANGLIASARRIARRGDAETRHLREAPDGR